MKSLETPLLLSSFNRLSRDFLSTSVNAAYLINCEIHSQIRAREVMLVSFHLNLPLNVIHKSNYGIVPNFTTQEHVLLLEMLSVERICLLILREHWLVTIVKEEKGLWLERYAMKPSLSKIHFDLN